MKSSRLYPAVCATVLAVVYAGYFTWLGLARYAAYDFGDFDLALKAQILTAALHGSAVQTIVGLPFYANHANFICFAALPFFAVWGTPVLIVVQVLFHAAAVWPLYVLASRRLGGGAAVLIVVAFLHYPALVGGQLFEVHPETWSIPFLLGAFLAIERRCLWLYLACGVGAMLCKENLPLVVAGLAVYALCRRGREWLCQWRDGQRAACGSAALGWVLIPLVGAFVYLALVMSLKSHASAGSGLAHAGAYLHLFEEDELGGSLPTAWDVVRVVLQHPLRSLAKVCTGPYAGQRAMYLAKVFGPVLFLPAVAPLALVPALPTLLQHLFSGRPTEWSLAFHYNATLVPAVFVCTIAALDRIGSAVARGRARTSGGDGEAVLRKAIGVGALLVAVACVAANLWLGAPSGGPRRLLTYGWLSERDRRMPDYEDTVRNAFVACAPESTATVATFGFLSHLADSRYPLAPLHFAQLGIKAPGRAPYRLPPATGVAMIDFEDRLNRTFWQPPRTLPDGTVLAGSDHGLRDILSGQGGRGAWRRVLQVNALALFVRPNVALEDDLRTELNLPPDARAQFMPLARGTVTFEDRVALLSAALPGPMRRAGEPLPVGLRWEVTGKVPNYWMRWVVVPMEENVPRTEKAWFTDAGPCFITLPADAPAGTQSEDHLFLAGARAAGTYDIQVIIYDRARVAAGASLPAPLGQPISLGRVEIEEGAQSEVKGL